MCAGGEEGIRLLREMGQDRLRLSLFHDSFLGLPDG